MGGSNQVEGGHNDQIVSESNSYSFEDALALIPIGKFHIIHLFVCGFCIMAMMNEVSGLSLVMAAAKCEFEFTVYEQGLLGSSGFIGVVIGSQIFGVLADQFGRRKILLITLGGSICSSVISAFSVNTSMLVAFRILTGFFISAGQSVMFSYLVEFHSTKTRVRYCTLAASFLPVATIYFPAIAIGILPLTLENFSSWRIYILFNVVPSILAIVGLLFLPRSPKFLLSKENPEECLRILQDISIFNTGEPLKALSSAKIIPLPNQSSSEDGTMRKIKNQLQLLFARAVIFKTLNICAVIFIISFIGLGIYMWLPIIIMFIWSNTNTESLTICQVVAAAQSETSSPANCNSSVDPLQYQVLLYLGICFSIFYLFISQAVTYIGRKPLFMCWIGIGGIFSFAMFWITNTYVIVLAVVMMIAISNCSGVLNSIASDYFPTNVNAMAMSLVLTFNKLGAVIGTNVIGSLLMNHCEPFFFEVSGVVAVTIILVFLLPCGR